jgi:hypothetical protein
MTQAFIESSHDKMRLGIVQAYYTAALQRPKKMPKLEELISKIGNRKEKKKMDSDTMLEKIKAMNKALGGD